MSVWGRDVDSPQIRAARAAYAEAQAAVDQAQREEQRAKDAYDAALRVSNAAYHKLITAVDAAERAGGKS